MSPTTLQRIAETIRKEAAAYPPGHQHKLPEPPVEHVVIGGEAREERNETHPDYLAAMERWGKWAMGETNERFLRIAAVAAIEPLDTSEADITDAANRMRRILRAEGVDLPYFDQYTAVENDRIVWLLHVAIGSTDDLQEFYAALTQRSHIAEEAVQAHLATFPSTASPHSNGADV